MILFLKSLRDFVYDFFVERCVIFLCGGCVLFS